MKKRWFILRILCTVSIIGCLFSGCNTQGDVLETQDNIEEQNQIEDSESEKADNKISKEQQKSDSEQKEENKNTTDDQKESENQKITDDSENKDKNITDKNVENQIDETSEKNIEDLYIPKNTPEDETKEDKEDKKLIDENVEDKSSESEKTNQEQNVNLKDDTTEHETTEIIKPETYLITYILNDGSNSDENPSTYTAGENIVLKDPSKEGAVFIGWYRNEDFSDSSISMINDSMKGNLTLYARWNDNLKNSYLVSYDSNEGNGSMELEIFVMGQAKKLYENKFSKKGYIFTGWNLDKNGQGVSFYNQAEVRNLTSIEGKVITLYAQWKPITYTIVFNPNGGTYNSSYFFEGLKSESGLRFMKSVVYDSKAFIPSYEYKNGNAIYVYNKGGYTIAYWTLYVDGSGERYKPGDEIPNFTDLDGDTVTLYAQWEYSIVYNNLTGEEYLYGEKSDYYNNMHLPLEYKVKNSLGNLCCYSETDEIVLYPPEERLHYSFLGWYDNSTFEGKPIEKISAGSSGQKELYAKWEIDTFTVTFDSQGGSFVESQTVPYYSYFKEPQKPFKENAIFSGWYYYSNKQKIRYDFVRYYSPTNDLTLYANWSTISISVLPESDIEVTKTQTENGYSFAAPVGYEVLGWYWDNILISTEDTLFLGPDKLTKGTHILSLEARAGNKYRSYTAEIRVE